MKRNVIQPDGSILRLCKCCHELKPLDDFRRQKQHGTWYYQAFCRECDNARARAYQRKARREGRCLGRERIVRGKDGRFHHHKPGGHKSGWHWATYWSQSMTEYLTREFPTTTNDDLCIHLGISLSMLHRKARELGLKKDPVWLSRLQAKCARKAQLVSRWFYGKKKKQA